MTGIPAYVPPAPASVTHLERDADRVAAILASHGDLGATVPTLARDCRWTHQRVRSALYRLKATGRVEHHGIGWRVTEAACP